MSKKMSASFKSYESIQEKFDPCPPITKYYSTPPHIYMGIQKEGLNQYTSHEALKKGTLWPVFYEYYETPYKVGGGNKLVNR